MAGRPGRPYGPPMAYEPFEPIHQEPLEIAPETFVVRCAQRALGAPLSVSLNSLVIRAAEPVLVDTGTIAGRESWLEDTFSLVDPGDVRWVFISHDDEDHTGNLAQVLERCPKATVVTTWAGSERMGNAFGIPAGRLRWVDDGDSFDAGDRVLHAVAPPVYDSPATRGLYDPSTHVYWASDCFATPMPAVPVDRAGELPAPMWAEGMAMFHHHALAPWLSMVDRAAFAATVRRLAELDIEVIAGAHTPTVDGTAVPTAMGQIAALPDTVPPPHPDQAALEAIISGGLSLDHSSA